MKIILPIAGLALLASTFLIPTAVAVENPAQPSAMLAPINLDLNRTSPLTNVVDAAGIWQFTGGDVVRAGTTIGEFSSAKRTLNLNPLNIASSTYNIVLFGQDPPQNLTIQGTHSFNNGNFKGGVSATSNGLNSLDGANVVATSGVNGTMTITP